MMSNIREKSAGYVIGGSVLGAIAFMGAFVNQQQNKIAEHKVERLDYCLQDTEADGDVVDKALQYCLTSETVVGTNVYKNFSIGSPTEEVVAFRNETYSDAHDIDWTTNVLPASGVTTGVYAVLGYFASRPLES